MIADLDFLYQESLHVSHILIQWWHTSPLAVEIPQYLSPSNVALNTYPGTVLESASPEDSKTPPT